jgi:hypothetical protein
VQCSNTLCISFRWEQHGRLNENSKHAVSVCRRAGLAVDAAMHKSHEVAFKRQFAIGWTAQGVDLSGTKWSLEPRTTSPEIPVTIEECIGATGSPAGAGAAIVHVHAYTGRQNDRVCTHHRRHQGAD